MTQPTSKEQRYEIVGLTRKEAVACADLLAGGSALWVEGHAYPDSHLVVRPIRQPVEPPAVDLQENERFVNEQFPLLWSFSSHSGNPMQNEAMALLAMAKNLRADALARTPPPPKASHQDRISATDADAGHSNPIPLGASAQPPGTARFKVGDDVVIAHWGETRKITAILYELEDGTRIGDATASRPTKRSEVCSGCGHVFPLAPDHPGAEA